MGRNYTNVSRRPASRSFVGGNNVGADKSDEILKREAGTFGMYRLQREELNKAVIFIDKAMLSSFTCEAVEKWVQGSQFPSPALRVDGFSHIGALSHSEVREQRTIQPHNLFRPGPTQCKP